MPIELIVQLAQAGGLILLVVALLTGQVWAKPAVDFILSMLAYVRAMLAESLAREEKLASALGENTVVMRELVAELRALKKAPR